MAVPLLALLPVFVQSFVQFIFANVPFLRARWDVKWMPNLSGRVALVTGGNTGLGYVTCLELARKGAKVYMASRTESRAKAAIERIKQQVPHAQVEFIYFDLQILSTAKAAAETFQRKETRLDMLINNAGVMGVPYRLSPDGIEVQACNGTGHFALTHHLLPILRTTATIPDAHVRIVTVSSLGHLAAWNPDFSSLEALNQPRRASLERYCYSKLSNILFTNELQKRLSDTNIFCLSVHPGTVATELGRGTIESAPSSAVVIRAINLLAAKPAAGALTQLYAATSPEVEQKKLKGAYLVPYGQVGTKSPTAEDPDGKLGRQFWKLCEELVKRAENKQK